jgi:hypothetical protein
MKYWPKVEISKCWSGILAEAEDAGRSIAILKGSSLEEHRQDTENPGIRRAPVSCFIRHIYFSNISTAIEDPSIPTPSSCFSLSSSCTPTKTVYRCLQPCRSSQTEAKANLGSLNIFADGTKLCEPTRVRFPRSLDYFLCASLHRSRPLKADWRTKLPFDAETDPCLRYLLEYPLILQIWSGLYAGNTLEFGISMASEVQPFSRRFPAVFLPFSSASLCWRMKVEDAEMLVEEAGGTGETVGGRQRARNPVNEDQTVWVRQLFVNIVPARWLGRTQCFYSGRSKFNPLSPIQEARSSSTLLLFDVNT